MIAVGWNEVLILCHRRTIWVPQKEGGYKAVPFADVLEGATFLRNRAEEGQDTFEIWGYVILVNSPNPTHIYNVPHKSTGTL